MSGKCGWKKNKYHSVIQNSGTLLRIHKENKKTVTHSPASPLGKLIKAIAAAPKDSNQ